MVSPAGMDPTFLVNTLGALGTPGAILLVGFWAFKQLEAARLAEKKAADESRASEKKASDEILQAHLTQMKEIAEINKGTSDALNGAAVMIHGAVGELRGIQRANNLE
jgi:hypothetical protein